MGAVGTSLGGAIASLFAFCANRLGDSGTDKGYFRGTFDIIPVTFGAPAIAKDEVYNGQPGQCFRGARVGIQQAQSLTLDPASTLRSLNIISGLLRGVGTPDESLESRIADLQSISPADSAQFSAMRNDIIESELPDTIIALTELIMTMVGGGDNDMMKFFPIILPLNDMTTLISNTSLLRDLLGPLVNESLPMPTI